MARQYVRLQDTKTGSGEGQLRALPVGSLQDPVCPKLPLPRSVSSNSSTCCQ